MTSLLTPAATTPSAAPPPVGRALRRDGYRADIDGLRAFAVLLVVTYHIWLGRVSGGVDVFLMLSAYFLTASFVRRLDDGGRPSLGRYWSRTFARLLPAAAITLVGTLGLAAWLMPPSTWPTVWEQTWASLFYVQNWALAASAVDYYAPRDALTSPLLHFWSLSIQGQVFLLWPVVIAIVWAVTRRRRVSLAVALAWVFGTVFVLSLGWSVVRTAQDQAFAYFDTSARLWEFAAGSLLALAMPAVRLPAMLAAVLTWAGLVGLVACGLVLDVAGGFPGYLALWPILSAAAVVVGGAHALPHSASRRLLTGRVLSSLGRIAYALYLVHWPLLIGYFAWSGEDRVGPLEGAAIVALSILLAVVITAAVERPARRLTRPVTRWTAVALAALLVSVPLVAWSSNVTAQAQESVAESEPETHPGAASLLPDAEAVPEDVAMLPAPTLLHEEWVVLDEECTRAMRPVDPSDASVCRQSEPTGDITVAVVGDSHSQQFMGALIPLAEERGWRLVSMLKGACPLGKTERTCGPWNESVTERLLAMRPDAVFTVATAAAVGAPDERIVSGIEPVIDRLVDAGIDVIAVRDNPRFDWNPYVCATEAPAAPDECSVPRQSVLAARNPAEFLDRPGVHTVDLSDAICPDRRCPAVVGNVAVYLDDNHLTWAYARTLAPFLEAQLEPWTSRLD